MFKSPDNENNNNINPNIKNMSISEHPKNFNKIDNNNNLSHTKNSKCNFILTKIDSIKKKPDENFLGKKRTFQTTFKTTKQNKENETNKKNLIKAKNINNIKIVNFSVNKNLTSQNGINKP